MQRPRLSDAQNDMTTKGGDSDLICRTMSQGSRVPFGKSARKSDKRVRESMLSPCRVRA